jgi:hypothetical protein
MEKLTTVDTGRDAVNAPGRTEQGGTAQQMKPAVQC